MWREHMYLLGCVSFSRDLRDIICVHHRHFHNAWHLAIHSFRPLPRGLISRLQWRYFPILPVDRTSTCPDFWPTGNHAITIILTSLVIVTDHYSIPWWGLNSRRSEWYLPSRWHCEWILLYTYFKLLYAVDLSILYSLCGFFNCTTSLLCTHACTYYLCVTITVTVKYWWSVIKFQRSWASPWGNGPYFLERILTAYLLYVSITHEWRYLVLESSGTSVGVECISHYQP